MDFYLHNFQMEARGALLPPFASPFARSRAGGTKARLGTTPTTTWRTRTRTTRWSHSGATRCTGCSARTTPRSSSPPSRSSRPKTATGTWVSGRDPHEVIVGLAAYRLMNVEFVNPFNDGTVTDTRGWGLMDMIGATARRGAATLRRGDAGGGHRKGASRATRRRTAPAKAFAARCGGHAASSRRNSTTGTSRSRPSPRSARRKFGVPAPWRRRGMRARVRKQTRRTCRT